MGQTLTRAAQWTTTTSGFGRLESTSVNESLLKEILDFVEHLSSKHPEEAELVFEEPLRWSTTLEGSDFKAGYDIRDSAVHSHEKDSEGQPLLQLSPPDVSVRCFSQLYKLLHLAGDKNLQEIRTCLEENRDPLAKILGSSFATHLEREGARPDVLSPGDKMKDDSATDSNAKVKLFALIQNADKQILCKLVEEMTKHIELNPTAVKDEVELLKQWCTEGEKKMLKSLRYTSDFEFSNGCRAPLWRQALGEMCYLVIEPCDCETLYITCSSAGVFLNGGRKQEADESCYEQTSDIYEDLVALLRSRSPHFAENINSQAFAVQEPLSTQSVRHVELVDGEEQGQPQRSSEKQEKNVHEKARQQPWANMAGSKKKYEPCPSKEEENKPSQQSGKTKRLEPGAKTKLKTELSESSSPGLLSSQKYEAVENKASQNSVNKKRQEPGAKTKIKTEVSVSSSPGRLSCQKKKSSAGAAFVEHFSETSSESEEEEEQPYRNSESNTDPPPEFWKIQKLVNYLKRADQIATVVILVGLMDFDLMNEACQLTIRDVGGLKILINLLDTDEVRCKIGSLKILRKIGLNKQIQRSIVDMGGLQSMVKNLDVREKQLKALAAETIANVAQFHRARRTVRHSDGIKKLVKLLDCIPNLANPNAKLEKDVEVARCGVLALWSCSKSTNNKEAIRKAGAVPLLGRLLKSPHENMLIPVVGTLQECASKENFRTAIITDGMIKDFVKNLTRNNDELQMHCASAVFKCAEDKDTRELVRRCKGLQPLVSLLRKSDNKQLLAAATGAIWKCSISMENVVIFQEYKALETLVGLLPDQPDEVLVNVVGALGEFAQIPANRASICKCGGIKLLVKLLTKSNETLLVNVTKAVGTCATDKDNMVIIEQLDGVRLVWSLLKRPNTDVQSSAAWALCPFIKNAEDAGEMVRSLIGGLELIIKLLESTNNEVLASICSVISKIAKDKDNLELLTDRGVVPLLTKLTNTTDDRLRHYLAEAIGHCCMWGTNRASFGETGAVAALVNYLKSKDSSVHQTTAMALYHLSKDPNNIIIMHRKGAVQPMIHLICSDDHEMQEFAAGCVRNIRLLALANKKARWYK